MEVVVSTITSEELGETMPLMGEFVSLESQQISARISAPIKEIKVDVGSKVKEGDVLAIFDDSQIKAHYRKAQAELALAQQSLQRAEALRGSPAYSAALTEDRRRQKDAAAAALVAAEASLQWTNVTAPYFGTISQRHAQKGQWASVGSPLFGIVHENNLEIDLKVPPLYFARLQAGGEYEVRLGKQVLGMATLRAEVPSLSTTTRSKTARLVPQFSLVDVAANQSVVVQLPTLLGTHLMVPKDAIIFEPNKTYAFVVTPIEEGIEKGKGEGKKEGKNTGKKEGKEQGKGKGKNTGKNAGKFRVEMRMLTLGKVHKNEFVVEEGLIEGDEVIIRGNERVIPNQTVRVRREDKW